MDEQTSEFLSPDCIIYYTSVTVIILKHIIQ
jgi:hypothetical protein